MTEAGVEAARGSSPGRRGVILSLGFPLVAWFFGSNVGLVAAAIAVVLWWTTPRPSRLLWPAAVGLLALAPFATWAQGLPRTNVVGADFGVRHWVANDLVISALVIATFAALTELFRLEAARNGPERSVWAALRRRRRQVAPPGSAPEPSGRPGARVESPAEPAAPPAP